MIELSHLQYFKEVARTENISKAAKSLYITQPALSQIIRKMEGELGYRLFERTGNRIRLTEAGKCFLQVSFCYFRHAGVQVLTFDGAPFIAYIRGDISHLEWSKESIFNSLFKTV